MADDDILARYRAAAAKLVDRIAKDPAYRQQLLDKPTAAIDTLLGLGWVPEEEASALGTSQLNGKCNAKTCIQTCASKSCAHGTCIYSCIWTSKVAEDTP